MVQKAIYKMRAEGIIADKIYIRTDDFSSWCKIKSLHHNSESRSKYLIEILSKR